jgi:GNAT superfamily N-acetyltransferase
MSAATAFQGQDVPASLFSDFAPPEAYRPHLLGETLWVVDIAGRPGAFLAALAHDDRLHIDELDVLREHQGRGIGRRLLAHAIDHARARGFACLSLTTFRAIPWNAPFYASLGFVEWDPRDAPECIRKALAKEAAFGLKDRCAMRLEL